MANAFIRISLVLWVVIACPRAFCQTQIQHQVQAKKDTLIQIQGPVLAFTLEVKIAGDTFLNYKTTANHYPIEWLYLPANSTSDYEINLQLATDDLVAAQYIQITALPTDTIDSQRYIENQRSRHQANKLDEQLQVLSEQHSDYLIRDMQVASLMFYRGQFNNSIEQLNALSDEKLSTLSERLILQKYRLLTDAYISLNQFHQALQTAVKYLQWWQVAEQQNLLSVRGLAEGQLAISYVLSHIEIDDQAMQPFAKSIACQLPQMPASAEQTLAQRTSLCLLNLVESNLNLDKFPHLAFVHYRNKWLYFNAINDHKHTLDTAQQALEFGQKLWEDRHNAIFCGV